MKTNLLIAPVLLASLTFCGCKPKVPSAEQPPARSVSAVAAKAPFEGGRKTSFQEVTAQLDPGGSLFLYLAVDQWLAGLSTNISELRQVALSLPGPGMEDPETIESVFDLLMRLVKGSGVEDFTGVGMSVAPIAPGLHRNKFILHHPTGAGQGFLWSMFGRSAHPLRGQDMLPANTALAAFGDLDVAQLWQVLERELTQSGIRDIVEGVRAFPQMFEKQTQIPWKPLLDSLGGEIGVILTLDLAKQFSIPGNRGNQVELPTPALLIAIKVNNDLLYSQISAKLQPNPQTVTSEEPGLKICAMPIPLPLPIALQLTVASSGDYFYFASSPDLVRAVQAVRQGKRPGVKTSAEFQALAKYLPAEGNQFVYVSQNLGQALSDVQQQAARESGLDGEKMAILQRFLGAAGPRYSLAIGAHTPAGWQTTTVGNQDSASAVMLVPVGVAAVGAGMLLPALAKAKSKAQTINSVNQLKQLGLAARMYANDHNDKFPTAQSWCDDLKQFVGNPSVYKAPNDSSPGPCSYAYNEKLSGMSEGKINPQTVLFFETDAGWNLSGGPELLLPRPRSAGVYVIGLADGSVQQVQAARIGSLRWDP